MLTLLGEIKLWCFRQARLAGDIMFSICPSVRPSTRLLQWYVNKTFWTRMNWSWCQWHEPSTSIDQLWGSGSQRSSRSHKGEVRFAGGRPGAGISFDRTSWVVWSTSLCNLVKRRLWWSDTVAVFCSIVFTLSLLFLSTLLARLVTFYLIACCVPAFMFVCVWLF